MHITIEESNTFWRLKAIAIFTIFFAHLPYTGGEEFMLYLFNYLGIVGVPIFLVLSGFFECGSHSTWKSKYKGLFVPLIIWGTIGFLPRVIFGDVSLQSFFVEYIKWIYGCGTWFYFVPVLFWCKLFTKPVNRLCTHAILILLSVTSIVLTQFNVIPYNDYFTQYTNPFNFMIYYELGILIRKYDVDFRRHKVLVASVLLLILVVVFWKTIPSYFNVLCIPFSFATFVLTYNLSRHVRVGENIGKMSYVIYLLHMVPMGIISRRIPFFWGTPFQIINVIIVFSVITFAVWIFKGILERLHLFSFSNLLGFR